MSDHVKVYGVKPRIQYTANGSSTSYDFPFAIFKTSDINVYLGETLQNNSNYTVSGSGLTNGGTVTFNTAPTSGTIITIIRNLSIERTSDFQEGGTLRSKVLNDELDYQIACQQQIAENLNRSMVLPPYATDNDLDLTLPTPSAGKAIVWNSDGTNLENSTIEVNTLESTLNGYKTAAQTAATTAANKASVATTQAQTATTQAGIATTKASEAASAVNQLNGIKTNCITEIPQDIKLELSEGTLTLKSGSVVTFPNGTQIQTTEDKTATYGSDGTRIVCLDNSGSSISVLDVLTKVVSGTTDSLAGTAYHTWYDTTNNQIVRYASNTTTPALTGISFPLAIVTVSDGAISSIDQVFNGFGYIGSTVFVLPGVKGLIPNGRNADGTLKNTPFTTTLLTRTYSSATLTLALNSNYLGYTNLVYNKDENLNYASGGVVSNLCNCGTFVVSNGLITSFNVKKAFNALDYNDGATIAGWAIPDYNTVTSISITSGTAKSFTATVNCFVSLQATGTGTQCYIENSSGTKIARNDVGSQASSFVSCCCFVKSGDTIKLYGSGTTVAARWFALYGG